MKETSPFLIEVVASTVQSCIAAEQGGAKRIELCTALATAGLTPGPALLRAVKRAVRIPVVVMIRPREGDFCYTREEMELMKSEIDDLGEAGADGFVFGLLTPDSTIDESKTRELVKHCGKIPAIFHRAIDCTPHILESLECVKQTGCVRVLSSGGATNGAEGIETLIRMHHAAQGILTIMPGGGLRPESFEKVLREELREYHLSGRLPYPAAHAGNLFDFQRQETDREQILLVHKKCEDFFHRENMPK
jgi:copper homeostasis protein